MASPSSSGASVSSDPPSPLTLPFSPTTDDGDDDEDEDTRASPQPDMALPEDLAPLHFPHLKPDSNAKVQVGRGWFKAYCLARGVSFDSAVVCTRVTPAGCVLDHKHFDGCVSWIGATVGQEVDFPPECSRPHRRLVVSGTLRTVERWMYNVYNHQMQLRARTDTTACTLSQQETLASRLPSWKTTTARLKQYDSATKATQYKEFNHRGDFALTIEPEHLTRIGLRALDGGLIELQTGVAVAAMDKMGNRGMNLRDGTMRYAFVNAYPKLNQGIGMRGLVFKNFNGHKGREGDTLFSACLPNRNAPECPIVLYGTLLLFRFESSGSALPVPEEFPSVENKASFHKRPLLRNRAPLKEFPHVAGVQPNTLRSWVAGAFRDVDLDRQGYDPLLHGLRHHCEQQLASDRFISKDDRERFMARAKDVQDRTYAANQVPENGQLSRAGYSNHPATGMEDEVAYMSVWNCACPATKACSCGRRANDEALDHMLDKHYAPLKEEEEKILAKRLAILELVSKDAQQAARTEFQLRECEQLMEQFRFAMKVALAGAASRPRDPKYKTLLEASPLCASSRFTSACGSLSPRSLPSSVPSLPPRSSQRASLRARRCSERTRRSPPRRPAECLRQSLTRSRTRSRSCPRPLLS